MDLLTQLQRQLPMACPITGAWMTDWVARGYYLIRFCCCLLRLNILERMLQLRRENCEEVTDSNVRAEEQIQVCSRVPV